MKLKELRVLKGVTQKDVAEAIGCSPVTYSRYESEARQPDIHTICLLAKYYETTTDAIIGFDAQ